MRKNGTGKKENEEKFNKMTTKRRKIRNLKAKWKKPEDFFFFAIHFQETTETFKGSTKMEIFTGKNPKSLRVKIGKSDFAPLKNFPVMPLPGLFFIFCCKNFLFRDLPRFPFVLNFCDFCAFSVSWNTVKHFNFAET